MQRFEEPQFGHPWTIPWTKHCVQWRTQKISEGVAKFRHNRVTSQINFRGSAEGILEGSGSMLPGKFCKITPKMRIFMHSGSKFWYNAFTRLISRWDRKL